MHNVFVYVDMSLTSGQDLEQLTLYLWKTDVNVIQQVDHLLIYDHGKHSFEVNFQEAISQAILVFVKIR